MGEDLGTLFDVFFSYHWRDHAPVVAVARRLTARGLRVFLYRRWSARSHAVMPSPCSSAQTASGRGSSGRETWRSAGRGGSPAFRSSRCC
jgi:hypothetical protein